MGFCEKCEELEEHINRKNDQLELLAKQCLGRAKENERLLKRLRCLRGMSQSLMLDVSFYACMHRQ